MVTNNQYYELNVDGLDLGDYEYEISKFHTWELKGKYKIDIPIVVLITLLPLGAVDYFHPLR